MTDSALRIIDAAGAVAAYKVSSREALAPTGFPDADPIVAQVLHHIEDPTQRAALITALGLLGSQTTLASILAAMATAANQTAANGLLTAIKTSLEASVDLAATLWTDDSGAFYVQRQIIDQDGGGVTVSFTTPTGAAATPGAGLRPAANEEALTPITQLYNVVTTNAPGGYTAGDVIVRHVVMNENTAPPSVVAATWLNLTTGAVIAAPTAGHIVLSNKDLAAVLSAGEAHIGVVGGTTYVNSQVPAVTATTYASGQVLGSLLTFPGLARVAGGTGLLQDILIHAKTAQTTALDLVLFHSNPTASTFTNGAPLAVNAADVGKVIGVVPITAWTSLGTPSIAQASQLAKAYKIAAGQVDGYAVLVARGAMTLASTTDLAVVAKALQD